MAGGKRAFDENDDMASVYLRRMQGDDSATREGTGSSRMPPGPPPATTAPEPPSTEASPPNIAPPLPPRLPSAQPVESDLPPGAPVLNNPKLTVNPGELPLWMASEGLQMLRQGDYIGAASYYEVEAKRNPGRAEGWLGIGAAMVGSGDFRTGVTYLLKGAEIDENFPIGALICEAKPGHPQLLINMAELFLAAGTMVSTRTAIDVVDECMRNPTTPQKIYLRANELRQTCRDQAEALQSPNLSKRKGRRIGTRRGPLASVLRLLFTLLALGGLAYGGWFGWRAFQGMDAMRRGVSEYKEAYQMDATGVGTLNASNDVTDPADLYGRAFTHFRQALSYKGPADFQTQFMLMKSGEAVLERARNSAVVARKLSPASIADIEVAVRQARTRLAKLDPTGAQLKEQQAKLASSLQTK